MLYNLSEFMTLIKEDIGIKDISLPVTDIDLTNRFRQSALKEFSVRCPRIETCVVGPGEAITNAASPYTGTIQYRIPKAYYMDSAVLAVLSLDMGDRSSGMASYYMPLVASGPIDNMITSISDIRSASLMGSFMTHAPTFNFRAPDIVTIYNGYTGGYFTLELALLHDTNLTTVPPTAMTNLRQLATLDIEAYLYNKLKRKDNLEVGIGTINLNINSWEGAAQEMKELLNSWDNEGANLDVDTINYYQ